MEVLGRKNTLYRSLLQGLRIEASKRVYAESAKSLRHIIDPQLHACILENMLF
jgi:hypothetical protein